MLFELTTRSHWVYQWATTRLTQLGGTCIAPHSENEPDVVFTGTTSLSSGSPNMDNTDNTAEANKALDKFTFSLGQREQSQGKHKQQDEPSPFRIHSEIAHV